MTLTGPWRSRSNTRPPIGGQVAQLVEQRTENPRVGGSIPPLATTLILKRFPLNFVTRTVRAIRERVGTM